MQFKTKLYIEDLNLATDIALDLSVYVTCPGDGGDSFDHAFGTEQMPEQPDLTKMEIEVAMCIINHDGSPSGVYEPTPKDMKIIRAEVLRRLEKDPVAVNWKIWN